jgi:hypothetical protein
MLQSLADKELSMRRQFRALTLLSFFLLRGFAAQAQSDPALDLKEVRIKNFRLIYDAKHHDLAKLTAARLNQLSEVLAPHWTHSPEETIVALSDRTDSTNGYATFLPRPTMVLFPVLPGAFDGIGEYHDWFWELLVHEYTHILSFEQRRDIVKGLTYIFGRIVTPNALIAGWNLEGVAVENETRYSLGGRLRSKLQAGTVRAMAAADRLKKYQFPEISGDPNLALWQSSLPFRQSFVE